MTGEFGSFPVSKPEKVVVRYDEITLPPATQCGWFILIVVARLIFFL